MISSELGPFEGVNPAKEIVLYLSLICLAWFCFLDYDEVST